MKKKIITLCLVIALLAVSIAGASLAYFTDTQEADNVFTMGDVDIELEEPDWDPDPEDGFNPGVEYAKNPYVTNTGDTDVWVRIKVTFTQYSQFMAAAQKHEHTDWTPLAMLNELDASTDKADTTKGWWLVDAAPTADTATNTITYEFIYKTLLEDGEDKKTSELFKSVTIPTWIDSEDRETFGSVKLDADGKPETTTDENGDEVPVYEYRFDIIVTADAIQDADAFEDDADSTAYEKAFDAFDNAE